MFIAVELVDLLEDKDCVDCEFRPAGGANHSGLLMWGGGDSRSVAVIRVLTASDGCKTRPDWLVV